MSRNRFLRNVAANWIHVVWGVLWGLVMTPILLRTLGKADYGVWQLIHSLVGNYGLLDLGARSAVIRFVSKGLAEKDDEAVNEVVNTALVLYIGVGTVALLITTALAIVLPHIEGFAASGYEGATLLIILLGATMAISLPGKLIEGVLSASERFDISNGIAIGFSLVRHLLFIALLFNGGRLIALAWVVLGVTVFERAFVVYMVLRTVPSLKLRLRHARRARVRSIFNYGIHTFFAHAGDRLRLSSDSLVIGSFLPPEMIAYFTIGQRPLMYLNKLNTSISRVLTPAFSRTEATSSGSTRNLERMLLGGTRINMYVTGLACLLLFFTGSRLIHLWVGTNDDWSQSINVLFVLLPAYLVAASSTSVSSILLGTSRHQILSVATIVEGLLNVGISIALIGSLGLVGVALGTAIPMVLIQFFVLPIYACRGIQLPFTRYLRHGIAPVLPALGAAILVGWFAGQWNSGPTFLTVVRLDLLIALVFGIVATITMSLTNDPILPRPLQRDGARIGPLPFRGDSPRVLLVAYRFPPQGGGGVQRPSKLVKYWAKAGGEVTVLTGPETWANRDKTLLDDLPASVKRISAPEPSAFRTLSAFQSKLRFGPLKRLVQPLLYLVYQLSIPDLTSGWLLPAIWRGHRITRSFRPHVIVVTGPPWTPFLVAHALSRLAQIPLVLDYRDPWTQTYLRRTTPILWKRLLPKLEEMVVGPSLGVVYAHRAIGRRLDRWLSASQRRLWVPNGYDPSDFPAEEASAPEDTFVLGYTGGFFADRSPKVLFEVIDKLIVEGKIDPGKFRMRLAGGPGPAVRLAKENPNIAQTISFEGYLPHPDSIGLLRGSSAILVLETDQEDRNFTTPGKFYESIYAGPPVLLLCPPGPTTRLAGYVGGCTVARPFDADEIRSAVLEMYQTWESGETLTRPDRSRMRFYEREHQSHRYLDFLCDMLGTRTEPRVERSRRVAMPAPLDSLPTDV